MGVRIAIYGVADGDNDASRWADSVADADHVTVVHRRGFDASAIPNACSHEMSMVPWRLDHARNMALSLTPDDASICISLDLHENLLPGWRYALERAWEADTTRMLHTYMDTTTGRWHNACRIHSRHGYGWRRIVSPELMALTDESITTDTAVVMYGAGDHRMPPDERLRFLRMAHSEDPSDMGALFMLGKEVASTVKTLLANPPEKIEAVELLERFLASAGSGWADERSEAQLMLSRLLAHEIHNRLRLSIAESQHRREPWLELCERYDRAEDWFNLLAASREALLIRHRINSKLESPEAWGQRLEAYHIKAKVRLGMI